MPAGPRYADVRAAAARIPVAARRRIRRPGSRICASAGACSSAFGPDCRVRAALRREAAAAVRRAVRRICWRSALPPRRWWSGRTSASGAAAPAAWRCCSAAADAGRFALELVPSVCVDDIRVSSSGVRAALAARRFPRGARFAGPAVFDARARGHGRETGPQARVSRPRTSACAARKLPLTGIFAVRVRGVDDGNRTRACRGCEPRVPPHGGWHRAAARSARVRFRRLSCTAASWKWSSSRRSATRRSSRASMRWCGRCTRTRPRRARSLQSRLI